MTESGDKSDYYYFDVLANTENAKVQIIPDGETWALSQVFGSANFQSDIYMSLVWNYGEAEEILFYTAGCIALNLSSQITGDGTKKLAIVLTNNSNVACRLGGSYSANKVNQ